MQPVAQIAENGIVDASGGTVINQQTRAVARMRRSLGDEFVGEMEIEIGQGEVGHVQR